MQKYNGQLIRQFASSVTGNAASGVTVTVRRQSDAGLATLYVEDNIAGATLSNPITTTSTGHFAFYAPDDVYTLTFSDSTPLQVIQLQDVAELQAQFDAAVLAGGYIPSGTFTAGATLTQANQVLSDGSSYWRWDGSFPRVVTAGSAPTPTGVGNWIVLSDFALRGDLAAADSTVLIGGVEAGILAIKSLGYYSVSPVGGELDAMPRIIAALNAYSNIFIDGELPVKSLNPNNLVSKKIVGVRGYSRLIVQSGTPSGILFNLSNNACIEGVSIQGDLSSAPVVTDGTAYAANVNEVVSRKGEGSLSAVKVFSTTSQVTNCEITRFSGWAVITDQNLNDAVDSNVTSCRIYQNFGGIYQRERSEYMKFSNNSICYNIYGIYKRGGNNTYTGNNIDHNRVNFVTTAALNDSHGSVVGGTMNHGKLATLVADNIVNGEVFSGVNMFDCGPLGIYIRKAIGVNLQGCLLGQTNIYCEGRSTTQAGYPGVNQLSNNLFNLHGGTYKIYRNWNPTTSQSDPATPDNCVFRDNRMMEGQASRDGSSWDEQIVNDDTAPDADGWVQRGTGNARYCIGTPLDGTMHLGNGATTGAIKIKLPPSTLDYTVLTIDFEISTSDGKGCSCSFDVYAQADGSWLYYVQKEVSGTFYTIRFGLESGRWIIYIGELGTAFNGGIFSIKSVMVQRGNLQYSKLWKYGWVISRETSAFSSVTLTSPVASIVNTAVVYNGDLNTIIQNSEVYAYGGTNLPAGGGGICKTTVAAASSDIRWQYFHQETTNKIFTRMTTGGGASYSSWVEK